MSVVSLCIIRIEVCNDSQANNNTMNLNRDKGAHSSRAGRRQCHSIEIQTYGNNECSAETSSLLNSSSTKHDKISNSSNSRKKDKYYLKRVHRQQEYEQNTSKSNDKDASTEKFRQISFVSGNPFVEITKGILHLYKEDSLTVVDPDFFDVRILCILTVPAQITCHDLLSFTSAYHNSIQHIRIIRDGSINQYMALIYFRSQEATREFYDAFNGVPFTSLEPECVYQLVYVSRVEIVNEGECKPPSGHIELPNCPVCLERMDESVDGILTILCNHSFHGNCLVKWGDSSCPVCRYVQTPELIAENKCFECNSSESLWICLICGYVGCGRYIEGHAHSHYVDTAHCYSMQLGTNRVWDYVGDNFVHRLLQNKTDGKLVEGPSPNKNGQNMDVDEKVDSMQLEYTYLLTSQLESQRLYYEDIIGKLKQKVTNEPEKGMKKFEKQVLDNKLNNILREKHSLDKKVQQLTTKLNQTQSELNDEKLMSKSLQINQVTWQKKFSELEGEFNDYKAKKEVELNELRDQLRDIMFYFEAQKSIEQSTAKDDIAGGTIIIQESPAPSKSANKSLRRVKRR